MDLDLDLDYLFRALFFETQGHFTLQNNITINLEITSSYDVLNQKPLLAITSFSVDYHKFNILLGGSILSYLIDLIEGFCDCVVKEQFPNLIQSVANMLFDSLISEINNKFLFDLNFTQIGIDLRIPQKIENEADHINFYLNALIYDPFEPFVNPPNPTELSPYNSSHDGIEITINQGVVNSLLWTLNNQQIFDLIISGDNLPVQLPFLFEIDTKLFELTLPEFFNYYGSNKIVDLHLNTTKNNAPLVRFSEVDSLISLQIDETISFFVRVAEDQVEEAFSVSVSFDLKVNCSLNESFLMIDIFELSFDNVEMINNKIPGLEIEEVSKMFEPLLQLAKGYVNTYLKTHLIAIPTLEGVKLENLELLIKDDNLVFGLKPILGEIHAETLKEIMRNFQGMTNKVKV